MPKQLRLHQIIIQPFNKWWKFVFANLVLGLLIQQFFMGNTNSSISIFAITYIWAFVICVTQWGGHVYINYQIDKRINVLEKPVKRTILGLIFLVVYSVLAYLIVQMIMYKIIYGNLPEDAISWMLRSSYFPVIVSGSISLLFSVIGFFKEWQKSVLQAEQLKNEMLSYKYESLRNQINPHFLFNSFNVLSDLVYDNQKMAVKFIHQLSDLFRYVLDSRDKELVMLEEEIEFINSFIYLLKIRFEDKVEVDLDIETNPEEYIVPMSLQLLIENAVKHNEVSTSKPLKIWINKLDEEIEVKNNLQLKGEVKASNKTGLKNLRQQYSYFTDKNIEVIESDQSFKVLIPILKIHES